MLFAEIDGAGWVAIIGALGGLVGTIIAGIVTVIKLMRRDNATDVRVDLLWEANLRRGSVESLLCLKSPIGACPVTPDSVTQELVFRPDVLDAYRPMMPYLQGLRRDNPGITKVQFAERVEALIGEWMLKHICIPLHVSSYACHDAAWEVSKLSTEPPPKNV